MEWYALLAVAGYAFGSIPFGLYAARRGRVASANLGNDVPLDLYRRSGSGRGPAGLAFSLELVKGFPPTLTGYLALDTPGAVGGRSAAFIGHNFPLFVRPRWRGSSSLAPLLGVLLALYTIVMVILGMVCTAALVAWRYASLAALVTAVVSPLALAALDVGGEHEGLIVAASVLWALLVFFAHRENVRRLLGGREEKVDDAVREARRGGRAR